MHIMVNKHQHFFVLFVYSMPQWASSLSSKFDLTFFCHWRAGLLELNTELSIGRKHWANARVWYFECIVVHSLHAWELLKVTIHKSHHHSPYASLIIKKKKIGNLFEWENRPFVRAVVDLNGKCLKLGFNNTFVVLYLSFSSHSCILGGMLNPYVSKPISCAHNSSTNTTNVYRATRAPEKKLMQAVVNKKKKKFSLKKTAKAFELFCYHNANPLPLVKMWAWFSCH